MSDANKLPNALGTSVLGPTFGAEFAAAGFEGLWATWGGDGAFTWAAGVTDALTAAVAAFVAAHDPTDQRPVLLAYAAAKRYAVETGGITVNGARIATDAVSQAKVGNAYQLLQASSAASVEFKSQSGFVTLTADQFKVLAVAVGQHVQACFAREADVEAAILASPATITTTAQIDAAFAALAA